MKNERLAERAFELLKRKSERALEMTRKAIFEEKMSKETQEALEYYLKTWEDTTRPGILSLAHEAVGGKPEKIVPLQVALQCIAAAMDIYDDLIDKSIIKGTEQTLYGRFGSEMALLLGSAFLVKGFNKLYESIENLTHERKKWIVESVDNFLFEVINAHILEVKLRTKKWHVKPEEYLSILEKKAADIEGRMRIGAIFGGGSLQEITALSKYGRNLGILLAIRSEFIDIYEKHELMNRIKHECLPLPVLYALQNTIHKNKIRKILSKKEFGENEIEELLETVYQTAEISRLKQLLNKLEIEAKYTLNYLQVDKAKDDFRLLLSSMLEDL
ncbi:MAG: polyprenyl synthetase family protein [Candidatus Bathyarchaeia archaeon]